MLLNGKDVHATEVCGAADETVVVQRRIKTHTLHRIICHVVPEHFVPIQINNNSVLVLNLEFICCEQGVHSKRHPEVHGTSGRDGGRRVVPIRVPL